MPKDLILKREMNASPATLYRCWTEPKLLKQFFAPAPGETIEAVIDPTPGGRFYTLMRFEEHGDIDGEGCVLIADPGKRFSWTDALSEGYRPNKTPFFTADIRFEAIPEGCRYVVTAKHADEDTAAQHASMGFEQGWGTVATQLEHLAATL